ncbi:hypothetical protein PsorP6_002289 [Peronosclerospora sorghi]|uniref:Uncharacterized protein n=1 Tax=Peronosclerospora sorghi TaxID=230839 RepID=A0ACC0WUR1_9STRA|nr:hypothetical protein PsorP6_002289 [Peronosclerospora sorghi]
MIPYLEDVLYTFEMMLNFVAVIRANKEKGLWTFNLLNPSAILVEIYRNPIVVNFAVTDGVAKIQQWDRRSNDTSHQYLKILAYLAR